MDAGPDILNHNVETVERLQKPGPASGPATTGRLAVLERAKAYAASPIGRRRVHTKSSIMVGLGETRPELSQTFRDLRAVDCDILTIGQYLRPSAAAPAESIRYYHPDEFAEMKAEALALGFRHVESGPLVRSELPRPGPGPRRGETSSRRAPRRGCVPRARPTDRRRGMTGPPGSEPGPAYHGRIGGGGRRHDPAKLVGLLVVLFLLTALIKPWDWGRAPVPTAAPEPTSAPTTVVAAATPARSPLVARGGSTAKGSPAPRPPASPAPGTAVTGPPAGSGPFDSSSIDWAAATVGIRPVTAWGVRALEITGKPDLSTPVGRAGLREDWQPAPITEAIDPTGSGVEAVGPVVIDTHGQPVPALGITTPANVTALDLRVSSLAGTHSRSLTVYGFSVSGDPAERLLLLPDGGGWSNWPSGRYRIDALMGSGVREVEVDLSSSGGNLPPEPMGTSPLTTRQLAQLSLVPGAFVVSGMAGVATYEYLGIDPVTGPESEAAQWLALGVPPPDRAPGLSVAQSELFGSPTLLGVAVSSGATLLGASLIRLAPVQAKLGAGVLAPGSGSQSRPRLVLFRPPDGVVGWPLGQYQINGTMRAGGSVLQDSWVLDLWPPSLGTASPLLQATRSWYASAAGTWSVVSPGREAPVVPDAGSPVPGAAGPECTGGAIAGVAPPYIGFGFPGSPVDGVQAEVLGEFGPQQIPARTSQAVPGLVLVQPLETAVWPSGDYVFSLEWPGVTRRITVCVS